jgi:ABC-2 type transport system ATP-binding protein
MNIIETDHLSKYYGKSKGIEDISLEVKQGDIFGFIGPNGAGKSTTIRILLNLIFPTSGIARILGMDVVRDSKRIHQDIGYVPSDANLYDKMSVMEFLTYCADFYAMKNHSERIHELSELFGLDLKRNITDLSMGNRKKVSIIQALIHSPQLLILDEPTTGLDPLIQSRLFELLRNENKNGTTIFFSSHVLSDVQTLCRTVAVVRDGKIVNIEDILTLRQKQLKKVKVGFNHDIRIDDFIVKGMASAEITDGTKLSFLFSGDIKELIRKLSEMEVKHLLIEEPSLEEIFLHYYN